MNPFNRHRVAFGRTNRFLLCLAWVLWVMAMLGCAGGPTAPQAPTMGGQWAMIAFPTSCVGPDEGLLGCAQHSDQYPFQMELTQTSASIAGRGTLALGGFWIPLERVLMGVDHAQLTGSRTSNHLTTTVTTTVTLSVWRIGDMLRGSVDITYTAPEGTTQIRAQVTGKQVN